MKNLVYHRILVKLSGEAFGILGIDQIRLKLIVDELRTLMKMGVSVGVVVGGGNLWRKREQGKGIDEITADYLGMMATVMNALVLRQALVKARVPCLVQTSIACDLPYLERIDALAARGALRRNEIVIFAGGTGKPYVTTDTAAAKQAVAIQADIIIKAGPVDGVYSADPRKVKSAKKFKTISAQQALKKKLRVIDKEAFELCDNHNIPMVVCKWSGGVLVKIVTGKAIGTTIRA